ncbi:hypothetical protein LJC40_05885 [Synergistaceae bacterium OttesenSCG-928-D05]|nr:hypothetical protein [Synergistaceae bacterium OttesenSCG-928-D05]
MKTRKSSLSLILAVLMLFVASVASAALTPNADGVYEIGTEAELKEFRDMVNDGQTDINAKLTANIALTGNWTPIGKIKTRMYNGVFDGANKTITNLTVVSADAYVEGQSETYLGLFGIVDTGAVLKNIFLQKVELLGDPATGQAGAIAGRLGGGRIENVGVRQISTISGIHAGGITGYGAPGGAIAAAYVKNADMIFAGRYGGGIVGACDLDISNCYVQDVTSILATDNAGGLAASIGSGAKISNSYVTKIGTIGAVGTTGGLVGSVYSNSFVVGCYVENIDSISSEEKLAGGIVGNLQSNAKMSNCYANNIQTISATASYAGGLVGQNQGVMENNVLQATGVVSQLSGASAEGGVLGFLRYTTLADLALLQNCSYPSNVVFDGNENKPIGNIPLSSMDAQYNVGSYDITLPEDDLPTLAAAIDQGYAITLVVGNTYGLSISTYPGTSGDFACGWAAGDPSIVNVGTDNHGSFATLTALSVGFTTVTIKVRDKAGVLNVDLSCTVNVVEELEPIIPVVSGGDPENIKPGEEVDITYDFGAGNTVDGADGSGLDGSGLTVTIDENGNVVLDGTAGEPGNYFFEVEITDEFGNTTTQIMPVTIVADAVISGTPKDGIIFPGEDVNLTYDFSPYIAIAVDNSGMQTPISGLIADILDGKVVVMGVSKEAGTYFYVVTLQRPDGSTFTQKVYVTVEGGSRPTGNSSGGGSSNCNTGVGAALFALLGLAFIQKRK